MGPSGHSARSADQGEAAAILDLGQPFLVHAGGVNLEEVIKQLRGILHTVDDIADPYRALKTKLLTKFTPKPLDLIQRIINGVSLATGVLGSSWRACWPCSHPVSQRA